MSSLFQTIPAGWHRTSLRHLAQGPKNGAWGSEAGEDEVDAVCVRVADFDWSRLTLELVDPTVRSFKKQQFKNLQLRAGDVVIEKSGGGEKTPVGRVVSFDEDVDAITSNFVARIRPHKDVWNRYFLYLLAAHYMSGYSHQFIKQNTGIQNLDDTNLFRSDVWVPDLPTQRQIAGFLDRETARIDLLIEKKQRFIEILAEKRFAETSSLVAGSMFRSEKQQDCLIPGIPTIPASWKQSRMKNACSRIIDCKNRTPDEVEGGEFFVVRTTCVRNGQFIPTGGYYTDESSYREWTQRGTPKKNDVIFTREAPVGEACIAPENLNFCLGQRTMIYRPDASKILPEYIIATVYSLVGKSYISLKGKGSTVGHLRVPEVHNFPCLLPSVEVQKIILKELDKRTGNFACLERSSLVSIDRLKEYRSALITAAVTGQIDVAAHSKSGTTDRRLDAIQEEMGA